MKDDEVWRLEERLWLEGANAYREVVDDACVMAFAAPVGIMRGPAIARSLEGAPRWQAVAMTGRAVGRPDDGTVVLGYRAEGRRAGSAVYTAYCTSTYRRIGERWKLVQHQQTPAA